jgi:hypothetical protein
MPRRPDTSIPAYIGYGDVYKNLAPSLWERGLNPVPIGDNKCPRIKWEYFQSKRMRKETLERFVTNFGDANLIAVPTGDLHNITVIDIDGDASDIEFAIDTFGYPRVMVETPSSGIHLYYSHSGEKSEQRIVNRLIDVRGAGGLIIVPGSIRNDEPYRFIEGGWNDFDDLTPMKSPIDELTDNIQIQHQSLDGRVSEGNRDNRLYAQARNSYRDFMPSISRDTTSHESNSIFEESQIAFANKLVDWDDKYCDPPLGDNYVRKKAAVWWRNAVDGTLYADGHQTIGMPINDSLHCLTQGHPRALALYMELRSKYPIGRSFTCPHSRARTEFNIDGKTLKKCLGVLIELGYVKRLHRGGRFSPSIAKKHNNLPDRGDVAWYVLLPVDVSKAS